MAAGMIDAGFASKLNGRTIRTATEAKKQTFQPGQPLLSRWIGIQSTNLIRHFEALRDFTRAEFGEGAAIPSEGHIVAANGLMKQLRSSLLKKAATCVDLAEQSKREGGQKYVSAFLESKEAAHNAVLAVEKVWDFYFELFGQRQSEYADWLLSCDRIALDCYQTAYLNVGVVKHVPAPGPFAYMRTGFSPSTFRRGITLRALGKQINPFPLIQLPYHRLVNPWTLGAILHEVSHNFQNELGIQDAVPERTYEAARRSGASEQTAQTWAHWNREMYADLNGLLLGGPAVIESLMDVVARSRRETMTFQPQAPHPTPFLRTLISAALLKKMGMPRQAERYRQAWMLLYPQRHSNIPEDLLRTFSAVCDAVLNAVCFTSYPQLGGKSLAEVFPFQARAIEMMSDAAVRLASGTDPGVLPARYMIGAARMAFDRKLASPDVIARNFYTELARR